MFQFDCTIRANNVLLINNQIANLLAILHLCDKVLMKELLHFIIRLKIICCKGNYELVDQFQSIHNMVSAITNIEFAKNIDGKISLSADTRIVLTMASYYIYCR